MPMIAEPFSSPEWTLVRRAVLIIACLQTAALLAITSVAQAQTSPGAVKLPNEIEFKSPVNPGVQTAVLYGDPSKEGVYVARNKLPAGLKVMRIPIRTRGAPPWCCPERFISAAARSGTRAN